MFLSIAQIKAARMLLAWTQNDLAAFSGLTLDQVRSFESGRTNSANVHLSIFKTLSTQGLDFQDGGVHPRRVSSYILESYMSLLEDVSRSMPNGGEVLKHCVDDRRSTPEVIKKVSEMRKRGIRERLTISIDNDFITGNPECYRRIPEKYFASSEVMIIYTNKVSFFIEKTALVIVSDTLSNVFRAQFEYWWETGEKIHVS